MPSLQLRIGVTLLLSTLCSVVRSDSPEYRTIQSLASKYCYECHSEDAGTRNLTSLVWNFDDPQAFTQWENIFDKVASHQMPPEKVSMPATARQDFLNILGLTLKQRDREKVDRYGRGTIRRLTRSEFQQNLRDLLQLPHLDIKDFLPEDRESHNTNRVSKTLDISRVQLAAYLEATDAALRQAAASELVPHKPAKIKFEAINMFQSAGTFGGTEAMFFAKDSKRVPLSGAQLNEVRAAKPLDTDYELAIFRSATWPYYGYPQGFVASQEGFYKVRFSARAVLQTAEFELIPAKASIPMTLSLIHI